MIVQNSEIVPAAALLSTNFTIIDTITIVLLLPIVYLYLSG